MAVEMKTIEFKENQEPAVSAENLNQMQNNVKEAISEVEENAGSGGGIFTGAIVEIEKDEEVPEGWEEVEDDGGIVTVTNEYGTAKKFPDGTMICHGATVETKNISIAYGSSYYANIDINFPETFIEPPTVTVTINSPSDIILSSLYLIKTFSAGGFVQCAKSITSASFEKNYTAIGRWK